jgi:hypothetical protein
MLKMRINLTIAKAIDVQNYFEKAPGYRLMKINFWNHSLEESRTASAGTII